MSRVYYVNDTSSWHQGSAAVNRNMKRRIVDAGHEIVATCYRPDGPTRELINACDMMIVNGEGTFRSQDDKPEHGRIERLRDGMRYALDKGRKVYLTNTVWYQMSDGWGDILPRLSGVSAREPMSAEALTLAGAKNVEIHPDEAYFHPISDDDTPVHLHPGHLIVGDFYPWNTKEGIDHTDPMFKARFRLSIFNDAWDDVVKYLHGASLYVTGTHHGVYAACKARVPFACCHVRTWKLSSLFDWAGVIIPIANSLSSLKDAMEYALLNKPEYEKLFDFLENQEPWRIPQ